MLRLPVRLPERRGRILPCLTNSPLRTEDKEHGSHQTERRLKLCHPQGILFLQVLLLRKGVSDVGNREIPEEPVQLPPRVDLFADIPEHFNRPLRKK